MSSSAGNVQASAALARGSEARQAKQKEELQQFVQPLKQFLQGETKSLTAASTQMKSVPGFTQKLTELRLNRPGGFKEFVKLFGDFEIQGPASGPGQNTIRTKRRRIVGKQRVPD